MKTEIETERGAILTDNKPRTLILGADLPADIRDDYQQARKVDNFTFDNSVFFEFESALYCLEDFEMICKWDAIALLEWDAFAGPYFDSVVIKITDDKSAVIVGRFQ